MTKMTFFIKKYFVHTKVLVNSYQDYLRNTVCMVIVCNYFFTLLSSFL